MRRARAAQHHCCPRQDIRIDKFADAVGNRPCAGPLQRLRRRQRHEERPHGALCRVHQRPAGWQPDDLYLRQPHILRLRALRGQQLPQCERLGCALWLSRERRRLVRRSFERHAARPHALDRVRPRQRLLGHRTAFNIRAQCRLCAARRLSYCPPDALARVVGTALPCCHPCVACGRLLRRRRCARGARYRRRVLVPRGMRRTLPLGGAVCEKLSLLRGQLSTKWPRVARGRQWLLLPQCYRPQHTRTRHAAHGTVLGRVWVLVGAGWRRRMFGRLQLVLDPDGWQRGF